MGNNRLGWCSIVVTLWALSATCIYTFLDEATAGVAYCLFGPLAERLYAMVDWFTHNAAYIGTVGFIATSLALGYLVVAGVRSRKADTNSDGKPRSTDGIGQSRVSPHGGTTPTEGETGCKRQEENTDTASGGAEPEDETANL
jgi:hypothetical protein